MTSKLLHSTIGRAKSACRRMLPVNDPDFMIIGAQKSGTSSLFYYLSQHPQLTGSSPKEVGFFHRNRHFDHNISDYRRSFRGGRSKLYFEATPEYMYHPDVASEIRNVYPLMKFIVLLREPGKRAYSAWNHYRDHFETGKYKTAILNKPRLPGNKLAVKLFEGRDSFPSFRECIDIELEMMSKDEGFEPGLLRRGLYLIQLEEYWKYFDRKQFLILGFKELTNDLELSLQKVANFIDVQDFDIKRMLTEPKNQRMYKDAMHQDDRGFLDKFYEIPNKQLIGVVGKLDW